MQGELSDSMTQQRWSLPGSCVRFVARYISALIHQYEECLKKKATKNITHKGKEPEFGPQPISEISLVAQSDSDSIDQDNIQIVWESRLMKTDDVTKKLEGLADNNLLSGADELLKAIKKPSKPKKRKRFPCHFCKGVYVSLANLHKHVAAFHIPGNRQRASSEYSLICINCSRRFKYNASLRRHAQTCVAMVRFDADMDIAEEEPQARAGTGYVVEGESDGQLL